MTPVPLLFPLSKKKPCDTSLPSFAATCPPRYWFNCIKFVAATIETERDDVRDDLRREGLELREEDCRESLPMCLLVGSKATCA